MASKTTGYTFLLWNGEYGETAKFVVKDNSNDKQSLFTPGKMKDLAWVASDLTKQNDVKGWQDFDNEQVDDLDDVVF
ncbi:hypothetical protein M3_0218 [Lysinibacillus phage vB_LfM_LysYB1]|nr:hypothetical protein M3_0218 [Lysinibacillus phage vB_LfM_LysYB1]WAB25270.1 hypothetical protein M5_0092 [Lysinibacillus phage vB_LfM_LysYB2]